MWVCENMKFDNEREMVANKIEAMIELLSGDL